MVIVVSPIYYARFFNPLIDLERVIAIELQDSEEHIFQRMVFYPLDSIWALHKIIEKDGQVD